ncbi:MAG TPA: hypothetical protein PKD86_06190 [Gemmatales bacterium]|nr:hypothetical protein [Gemmatales bacterium]HMP58925.1 hypothetical protein [Gemmatales bacterium]
MIRRLACVGLGLTLAVATLLLAPVASACPFCGAMQGQTLAKEVQQARFVVFGTLANPQIRLNPDGTEGGTTDLNIEAVVKEHEFLKDRSKLVLPRYIPVGPKDQAIYFLVFCDLFQDRIDPYRGLPMKDKDVVTYLKGALPLEEAPAPKRLKFYFDYLDHEDPELATDAYREFASSDYKDVLGMIEAGDRAKLRDKLVHWLRDPNTPAFRLGFYGMLLGHCGQKDDVAVFKELLADPERAQLTGLDGVLAGYVLLDHTAGWATLKGIVADEKREFQTRYSGLRALRFMWDYHPTLVPKSALLAALETLLGQKDIADLVIDDLRKWQEWSLSKKVLPLHAAPSHDVSIIKRAIVKYAIRCPNPEAQAFIAEQRRVQPDLVRQIEELLELEAPLPPVPPKADPNGD